MKHQNQYQFQCRYSYYHGYCYYHHYYDDFYYHHQSDHYCVTWNSNSAFGSTGGSKVEV